MKKLLVFIAALLLTVGIYTCSDDDTKVLIIPINKVFDSCDVVEIEGGYEITCGDQVFEIYHGEMTVEVIDPCGDNPDHLDEVLVRVGDQIFAFFTDVCGSYEFITILPPGNYITTDKQACHFTITEDFDVIWE